MVESSNKSQHADETNKTQDLRQIAMDKAKERLLRDDFNPEALKILMDDTKKRLNAVIKRFGEVPDVDPLRAFDLINAVKKSHPYSLTSTVIKLKPYGVLARDLPYNFMRETLHAYINGETTPKPNWKNPKPKYAEPFVSAEHKKRMTQLDPNPTVWKN